MTLTTVISTGGSVIIIRRICIRCGQCLVSLIEEQRSTENDEQSMIPT